MTLTIERAHAPDDDVRALVGELDAWLAERYNAEQRHGLSLDALFEPHVRFFIARRNGDAAGCGGVAFFAGYAEIKRMYVREAARGTGVAHVLLAHLEAEARDSGAMVLRLETGVLQPAARSLYARAGFVECAAFGPYATLPPASIERSIFMEKHFPSSS
jgi:putative acetyltransferase